MEPFETLFFFIAVQGYFLALLLLLKRPLTLPATLLSVFIALVSTETLLFYLLTGEPKWTHAVMANRPIWFLYGPIVYGFGRAITGNLTKPGRYRWLHVVPFLIGSLVLSVAFFPQEPDFKLAFLEQYLAGDRSPLDTILSLAAVIHLVAYGGALRRYLTTHSQRGRHFFASTHRLRIRSLMVLSAVLWLAAGLLLYNWAHPFGGAGMTQEIIASGIFGIMSIIVYSMGYFGLCRPEYFNTENLSLVYQDIPEESESIGVPKAEPSTEQPPCDTDARLKKITDYMAREQPFLSSDFSLQDLSVGLGVPAHKLSRTINHETGSNFFQFVNQYRIEEVKKQLADPATSNKTLLAMALCAGFNSKSTFNAAFKKVVGTTPTQYRKQLK